MPGLPPFLVLNKRVCGQRPRQPALLGLKQPMGDISARGAGGDSLEGPLGSILVALEAVLGRSWRLLARCCELFAVLLKAL